LVLFVDYLGYIKSVNAKKEQITELMAGIILKKHSNLKPHKNEIQK
jgi:hypothetical protein